MQAQGTVLPNDYFLTRDKNGNYHWFKKDPLRCKDKDNEIRIEDEIGEVVGRGDIGNPVLVRLNCAKINRSISFNIGLLSSIRRGREAKHFEDMDGNVIDVLEVQNSDNKYPLTGAVFNSQGDVIQVRKYSFEGVCSDGVEAHHLMAINGAANFDQPKAEKEVEGE